MSGPERVQLEHSDSTIAPHKKKTKSFETPVPSLTIVAHPNPSRIGERVLLSGLDKGATVALSRREPMFKPPGKSLGRALDDPFISREPLLLRSDGKSAVFLDRGKGKIDVICNGTPTESGWFFSRQQLEVGVMLVLAERVVLLLHLTRWKNKPTSGDHGLVGYSDSILFLRAEIERVADLTTPVLLRGATGSGKELVASAIHEAGRPGKPFVCVNLAALPSSLAAAELFGSVKGAFTGSERNQLGYFRSAQNGTLFLDEVGEASLEIQVMLLRALETGEVTPLGSQASFKVNARLVAATDANLETMMADDSFKTPLFHRLAGYEITLPTLIDRLEDFGRLFIHFAAMELDKLGENHLLQPRGTDDPWLPTDLMQRLLSYSWPGNVRQLRNTVSQLLIGCRGESSLHSVPNLEDMLASKPEPPATPVSVPQPLPIKRKPSTIPSDELILTMKHNHWDIKATAAQLGISRPALYLLIAQTPGLRTAADLSADEIEEGLARHSGDVQALADELMVSPRALRRRISQTGPAS